MTSVSTHQLEPDLGGNLQPGWNARTTRCWRCAGSGVPTAHDLITDALTLRLPINLVRWPSLEVSSNRSARLLVFP